MPFCSKCGAEVSKNVYFMKKMAIALNYHVDDIGAYYGKKPENCKKYGALYEWDEAMEVCPPGWHLPSGNEIAGKKLKAKSGWAENKCKYTIAGLRRSPPLAEGKR